MLKVFKFTSYLWKNNSIQIKISNGLPMDLKRTSNEPLWGPHDKPLLCTYMIELKHPVATVPSVPI